MKTVPEILIEGACSSRCVVNQLKSIVLESGEGLMILRCFNDTADSFQKVSPTNDRFWTFFRNVLKKKFDVMAACENPGNPGDAIEVGRADFRLRPE